MNQGRNLLLVLPFAFIVSTATAQQKALDPRSQEAPRAQSANQIVGFSDQKPALQTNEEKKKDESVIAPPTLSIEIKAAVIPPAPSVVKLSSNSISIPADKASPETKYEQKPAVASQATVGSVFGVRRDPFTRRAKFHSGVDIKARLGDPVGASQRGVVEFAGWYYGYGYLIIVHHGGGIRTHYAHLSSFDVEVGTRVERGTIIGRAGATGRATSPHLHYEVRLDGIALNPFQPLALDASSDYFKQTKSPADATGHEAMTEATRPRRVN